jgi:methionine synthase II (cobalamin-independent)
MARLYRADHAGSLLRPQELLDARKDPQVTREQLTAIEDRHILGVLTRQKSRRHAASPRRWRATC